MNKTETFAIGVNNGRDSVAVPLLPSLTTHENNIDDKKNSIETGNQISELVLP